MNPVCQLCVQAMWILAFSVSFSLLACSSREGERGLLEAAPFSGSAPLLTSVGMELPTGGATCLGATCFEPMTGMDMPFSSLAGGASTVTALSDTGGFGGVMLWRLSASLMEFFTTRQLLLAGRGEEASGSSMLGSLCVLEVSMVGMGFAFDPDRGVILGPSPYKESEDTGYGSLNVESSLDTTSASLCLLVRSSCVGECGLLAGAPLTESSRPLGSSLGLLVALGSTFPLSAVLTELLAGGEGGFALTGGFEPMTGMDMPWSVAAGAALGASLGASLGAALGSSLGAALGASLGASLGTVLGAAQLSTKSCLGGLTLSSVSDAGLEGLLVGELKGVPESVSLELSR